MTDLAPPPAWLSLAAGLARRLPAGRYRLAAALSRRPTPPFLARLPETLGGWAFACDLGDAIAREAFFTGRYEPQETILVPALLDPGAVFVDLGANWGYFSLLAAGRVGDRGRVIALEPDPRLLAALQANLSVNGLARVEAVGVAAADREAVLTMAGYEASGGNWGLSRLVEGAPPASVFPVAARPLDALLDERKAGAVDLLKMDIEGSEDLALKGMRAGLAGGRYRRVLLELHPGLLAAKGSGAGAALAPLREAGYRGWRVDHSPEATRRAAYDPDLRPSDVLTPLDDAPLDAWPHQLWAAPGLPCLPGQ